jgi:peptidoglycan/LPS O-acetylase OafA/YrhL
VVLLLFVVAAGVARSAQGRDFTWLFANSMPWYSYATFTQNFWMVFYGSAGGSWLAPTWSLAVEEQFYLTLPLVIRFVSRQRLVVWLVLLICCAPLLRMVLTARWWSNDVLELVTMPCRSDALFMGVLAAVLMRDAVWRERIARSKRFFPIFLVVLMIGVALLGRFAPGASFPLMRTVGFTWLAGFYVSILLFAITRPASWLSRSLRNRALTGLGLIAYGVYLVHQTVQGLIFGYFGKRPPGIREWRDLKFVLVSLGVTLALARMSWLHFERPLVRVGHRFQYRQPAGVQTENLTLQPQGQGLS